MKIGIIGAGPAGIMTALEARKRSAEVLLLDANPSLGRKLAATGSGRCNLTNTHAEPSRYFTSAPHVLEKTFSQFGYKELITWLAGHGIFTYATEDGWVYPLSNSATNVVDILNAYLREARVEIYPQIQIMDIQPTMGEFRLTTADPSKSFLVDRVVVAAGGPAYPQLGARNNLFTILKKLGHTILPVKPALTPLLTDTKPFHKLQGVRLDAGVTLLADGKEISKSKTVGNIIFASWGLNGPGVMDLSYLVSLHSDAALELKIDLIPDHHFQLLQLIHQQEQSRIPFFVLLESVLPSKAARLVLQQCGHTIEKPINQFSRAEIEKVIFTLKNQPVQVKGTKGFKESQLSTGGVSLKEVNPDTMESIFVKGIFFAGEILDVAGPCGGYNLQWAFTSGYVAGNCVASQ